MRLIPMGTPGKCPAHITPWTTEQDELLINLYPSVTCHQIAHLLGRSINAVKSRVSLLRDMGQLTYKRPQLTPEQLRFIRSQHHKATIPEVAAILGVTPSTVWRRNKKQNISYRKCGDLHPLTKHTDSDVELIRQLRDNYNLTFREIGEKFNISRDTCRYLYRYRQTAADAIAREYLPR
ncbi:hypothetical protein B5V48_26445 [Salmonella enterica]|nr:hypothetical protein [Salmonella enterica]